MLKSNSCHGKITKERKKEGRREGGREGGRENYKDQGMAF